MQENIIQVTDMTEESLDFINNYEDYTSGDSFCGMAVIIKGEV